MFCLGKDKIKTQVLSITRKKTSLIFCRKGESNKGFVFDYELGLCLIYKDRKTLYFVYFIFFVYSIYNISAAVQYLLLVLLMILREGSTLGLYGYMSVFSQSLCVSYWKKNHHETIIIIKKNTSVCFYVLHVCLYIYQRRSGQSNPLWFLLHFYKEFQNPSTFFIWMLEFYVSWHLQIWNTAFEEILLRLSLTSLKYLVNLWLVLTVNTASDSQ